MHQYLELGSLITIPLYNLSIGIGAVIGFLVLENEIEQNNIDFQTDKNIYLSLIIAIIFGIIGSKLFYLQYYNYELSFNNFSKGGFTFMGGIIVSALSLFATNKFFKISITFSKCTCISKKLSVFNMNVENIICI